MLNINIPSTSTDVLAETMRIPQKCAKECGQSYGVVTYDLDVTKNTIKIKVQGYVHHVWNLPLAAIHIPGKRKNH